MTSVFTAFCRTSYALLADVAPSDLSDTPSSDLLIIAGVVAVIALVVVMRIRKTKRS